MRQKVRKALNTRILGPGAGFGGMELTNSLSKAMDDAVDVTLIDRSRAFAFGYAKLGVLFEGASEPGVRKPYRAFAKPDVPVA
ncbi:MAG: hypothetical protein MUE83_16070 [Tabrizicola sp.]|jgi:sulfide:quinone oxidoreductase|nr:hypothetical protein [Tabrizicola sp.]